MSHKTLPSIEVRNLQRKYRVNCRSLQSFTPVALQVCHLVSRRYSLRPSLPDEIFILLISDRRMAELHRKFLHQTGPTDVITFQHGEIFISVPTAFRQARQFGTSAVRELQLYLVHGLLHLHGFDDRNDRDRRQMRAAETAVLRRVDRLK